MDRPELSTTRLLERWYQGEAEALDLLLASHLDWIRAVVRRRLGPQLRRKLESGDVVQEAILRFLKDGPRCQVNNGQHFRRLMARIVENVLRDRADWFQAKRRDLARELEASPDWSRVFEALRGDSDSPSSIVGRQEFHAAIRLALELLEPNARQLVLGRLWLQRPYAELAAAMETTVNAAELRYRRALSKLLGLIEDVLEGRVEQLLERAES